MPLVNQDGSYSPVRYVMSKDKCALEIALYYQTFFETKSCATVQPTRAQPLPPPHLQC